MAVNLQAVPGTGLIITPDNSGNMTFSTGLGTGNVAMTINSNSNVTMGGISVNTLNVAARGISSASMPAGTILQVLQGSLGTSFTALGASGSGYWVTVTGLSVTITPTSNTSKILVMVNMYVGVDPTADGYQQQYQILRNGSVPSGVIGSAEGGRAGVTGRINMYSGQATGDLQYRMGMLGGQHIDTPATTSALTYGVQLRGYSGSPTVYVNRQTTYQNGGTDYDGMPLSTITVMEIAQ